MTGAIGRSLELFYIDGRPDGMLTAEVFNWTGHVLMTPRTQLSMALTRSEARYTGIYLLLEMPQAAFDLLQPGGERQQPGLAGVHSRVSAQSSVIAPLSISEALRRVP